MPIKIKFSLSRLLLISVIGLLLVRFILIGAVPLLDKTEARYAEISRIMVATSEWVVPQVDFGFPFWAKPPLSMWFSALSYELFGISELAARLPSFLMQVLLLLFLGIWAKKRGYSAVLLAFILLSTPEFLIHTGVVSTDTALSFCVVVAMLSFWEALQQNANSYWKYLFYIALGFGLLAKGPIMLLITLPPILIWVLLNKISVVRILRTLKWKTGILLTLIIALPWYIFAELKSPGFLNYFIIGEHFRRFFDPSWTGDLYGVSHKQARGTIWLFLLLFAFPWIQLVLYRLWKTRKAILKNEWTSFLVLWLLWIPVFFTFSTSILHTYILPAICPMAILALQAWKEIKFKKTWLGVGAVFPITLLLVSAAFFLTKDTHKYLNTDKYLIRGISQESLENSVPLYYWKSKSYSGQFYSKALAQTVKDSLELEQALDDHESLFILVSNKRYKKFPVKYVSGLKLINSNYKTSVFLLQKDASWVKYSWKESKSSKEIR